MDLLRRLNITERMIDFFQNYDITLIFTGTILILFAVVFIFWLGINIYLKFSLGKRVLELEDLEYGEEYKKDDFLKNLLTKYKDLLEKSKENINTNSFVESFFSQKKLLIINCIKFIEKSISIFILLGVLGTFIGLTTSLRGLDSILTSDMSEVSMANMAEVLSGMEVAFYTSILGLFASLFITILMKAWPPDQKIISIMLSLENYLDNNIRGSIERETHQIEAINSLAQSFDKKITSLEGIITDTFIESFAELEETMSKIYVSMNKFNQFSQEFDEAKEYMMMFNEGLNTSVDKFEDLYKTNENLTEIFTAGVEQLKGDFNNFGEMLIELVNEHKLIKDQTVLLENISDNFLEYKTEMSEQTDILADINNGHDKLAKIYKELNNKMTKIDQNLQDYSKVSKEQVDLVTGLNQSLKNYNKQQQQLVNNYSQIESLNKELKSVIISIKGVFNENMINSIMRLEKILEKLESKFTGSLQKYIKKTNNIMEDKFNSINSNLEDLVMAIDINSDNEISSSFKQITSISRNMNQSINKLTTEISDINQNLINYKKDYEELSEKLKNSVTENKDDEEEKVTE